MKYPINKEFFPFSHFTPPIKNAKAAGRMNTFIKSPKWLWKDREVQVTKKLVKSYDGAEVEMLFFEPYGIEKSAPCLVYYHGGGFFFSAAGYHYRLAKQYALETPCKVAFVQYRLTPKHPYPTPLNDCFAALEWVFENADRLGVNKKKIAVAGDSAGGNLAAAVCQMTRDKGKDMPLFQLLIYPVTDRRIQTESCRKYTDTPMWNSKLSVIMWNGYIQADKAVDIAYASPMETESFENLPNAYVETAEFDCLHDEAVAYAQELQKAGVTAELFETKGTMHGFDFVQNAPTAKTALLRRIKYMKKQFYTCHPNSEG